MKQLKKLLAPTDLSSLARAGIRFALETAQACGVEIIVYHVISYEDEAFPVHHGAELWAATSKSSEEIQELIWKRKQEVHEYLIDNFSDVLSGLKIREEVEIGIPDKMIVEKAAAEGVDMIVMSTHGRTGLRHFLIGSVTEQVIRHATCPVLSVRPSDKESSTAKGPPDKAASQNPKTAD
jgi:nucleotide-binding universal stress UspA family protein